MVKIKLVDEKEKLDIEYDIEDYEIHNRFYKTEDGVNLNLPYIVSVKIPIDILENYPSLKKSYNVVQEGGTIFEDSPPYPHIAIWINVDPLDAGASCWKKFHKFFGIPDVKSRLDQKRKTRDDLKIYVDGVPLFMNI